MGAESIMGKIKVDAKGTFTPPILTEHDLNTIETRYELMDTNRLVRHDVYRMVAEIKRLWGQTNIRDGKDCGVDFTDLNTAIAGVEE